jgi:hypothetical protein
MQLTAPNQTIFYISVALAVIAVVVAFWLIVARSRHYSPLGDSLPCSLAILCSLPETCLEAGR